MFGPAHHGVDEIAMVEIDLERGAREIGGRELERRLRQIDTVIVADLGSALHLMISMSYGTFPQPTMPMSILGPTASDLGFQSRRSSREEAVSVQAWIGSGKA
jgi:hypothetical protein